MRQMTYNELIAERNRVKDLLRNDLNKFTQKQNKKYLEKIYKELRRYGK